MAGRQFAVSHQVRAQRTGRGARRSILVESPWQHAAGKGFAISAERETVSHGRVLAKETAEFDHIHDNFAQRGAISQRHHQVEDARGNKLRLQFCVEILRRNSTGKIPAPVSCRTWTPPSWAGTTPSSASKNHVPITGCPASLSSSFAVKMRSRASASSLVGFCTNTVSERFISRAIASIWSSESPSPSVNTASGLPSKRLLVQTSRV